MLPYIAYMDHMGDGKRLAKHINNIMARARVLPGEVFSYAQGQCSMHFGMSADCPNG